MIDTKELREAIQTFGSQAINEGDLNELLDRLEAAEADALEQARLIAAALELLEALQNIAEYWNQDQNEAAMADACWHAIHTARAAIAKATGEQP